MSLLDTNSDELIAAAEQAPAPIQRKEPTQRFSTWRMLGAAPKGVAAGAAEATGSTADILGAFGQALATTGGSGKGMFATPTPEERKQTNEATDKLLKEGIDYNSEAGRAFRNVSADYTPDPQTAHVAESAVFNLFRVGSKALTSAATMGNIPGAVVAGLEEGFTQSDQLGQQGVDLATRSKVGAVTAVTNAVGFALPVAGATWKSTAALAVAGGPASFIAQNAATREILQAADYSKLADQYDPLDPVGLALSTLLPLGFGALAMRGAKVKPGVESKGPMPDGTPPPDTAPPKADHPPADLVDAARVNLVREHMDGTNPKAGDLEAADAHTQAYKQAMEQQAAGELVSVADIAPKIEPPAVLYHGTPHEFSAFDSSKIGTGEGAQAFGRGIYLADSEAVAVHYRDVLSRNPDSLGSVSNSATRETAAAWIEQAKGNRKQAAADFDEFAKAWLAKNDPATYQATRKLIAEPEGNLYALNVQKSALRNTLDFDAKLSAQPESVAAAIRALHPDAPSGMTGGELVKKYGAGAGGTLEADLQRLGVTGISYLNGASRGGSGNAKNYVVFPGNEGLIEIASRNGNPIADWGAGLTKALDDMAAERAKLQPKPAPALADTAQAATKTIAKDGSAPAALDAPAAKPADTGQPVSAGEASLDARLADISYRNPTALDAEIAVAFDEKGKPTSTMTAREYLDKVKQEAASDIKDASLFEVAANCFLSGGA